MYRFCLFYFVFKGNFPSTSPREAYMWRGDLTEGFLRYRFGELIFGEAYFRNFTVTQMLTDTLIRGRRTTYEVNVSGALFSPFPETKKRLIAGYVRYDVIYHLFPINSQYI